MHACRTSIPYHFHHFLLLFRQKKQIDSSRAIINFLINSPQLDSFLSLLAIPNSKSKDTYPVFIAVEGSLAFIFTVMEPSSFEGGVGGGDFIASVATVVSGLAVANSGFASVVVSALVVPAVAPVVAPIACVGAAPAVPRVVAPVLEEVAGPGIIE